MTIVALDPSVRRGGRILTARIQVPREELGPGPRGYRAYVVDYDSSAGVFYEPFAAPDEDPFEHAPGTELIRDPRFHAQNVYAIVMRILGLFERALGRRVPWSFGGHQIKIAPHAFAGANAPYSKEHEALLFGYFPSRSGRGTVYTCLSHDIIAHETAHALLDGLRERYTDPSSPDQAGFHEGFADIVSTLSVFSLPEVVAVALDSQPGRRGWRLRGSLLLSVGRQIGRETGGHCHGCLRRPTRLKASKTLLGRAGYQAAHRRGEILAAAMLDTFLCIWESKIQALSRGHDQLLDRRKVIELGARIADALLTVGIRALDYAPPTDIRFSDYLSALLTADWETARVDAEFQFRRYLRASFGRYGIVPAAKGRGCSDTGVWPRPEAALDYSGTNHDAMQRDRNEVFRFIWQNRRQLGLSEEAYTRVASVRPCVRVGPDGFVSRETVAEYIQVLRVTAGELRRLPGGVRKPTAMLDGEMVTLYGGGALILDEHGTLTYHVRNAIEDGVKQSARLRHLWRSGHFQEKEKTIE
jgi:hypothetical protein